MKPVKPRTIEGITYTLQPLDLKYTRGYRVITDEGPTGLTVYKRTGGWLLLDEADQRRRECRTLEVLYKRIAREIHG